MPIVPDTNLLRSPAQVRNIIRQGGWDQPTAGLAPGFAQANLVILPKVLALDFFLFCQRNPKPCPLLDVTDPGNAIPARIAVDADIRTDIPRYRVYRRGELIDEPQDIIKYWDDTMVAFLLGCSFSFEQPMLEAGIPIRHIEQGCNVPMFITNQQCEPAGDFSGPMVVSMRPIAQNQLVDAVKITSRFPGVHGAPVHIGDPAVLGISDLQKPDFGDPVPFKPGEIPVFWACGVTPQAVAMQVKPELIITHAPGFMFVSDLEQNKLAVI